MPIILPQFVTDILFQWVLPIAALVITVRYWKVLLALLLAVLFLDWLAERANPWSD